MIRIYKDFEACWKKVYGLVLPLESLVVTNTYNLENTTEIKTEDTVADTKQKMVGCLLSYGNVTLQLSSLSDHQKSFDILLSLAFSLSKFYQKLVFIKNINVLVDDVELAFVVSITISAIC